MHALRKAVVTVMGAMVMVGALSASASAAPASAAPAGAAPAGDRPARPAAAGPARDKPAPVAPPTAWDPGSGPRTTPKPAHRDGSGAQTSAAWSVGITASPSRLWPTQWSTITATTNQDVGPTPYYIIIVQSTSDNGTSNNGGGNFTAVAICGGGTSCGVSLKRDTVGFGYYNAYVGYYPSSLPVQGVQAAAPGNGYWTLDVNWHGVGLGLASNVATAPVGGTVTLTATTGEDVGASPFYIQIYDQTTGTRLNSCGYGTACSVQVSQAQATTHAYGAVVSDYTTAWPPTGAISWSAASYVTWSASGFQISLTAPRSASGGGYTGYVTVTATTNLDVGPTPYFIQIFNQGTGALVGRCASGTTCTVTAPVATGWNSHVAFVSAYDNTFWPASITASSNSAHTEYSRIA